LSGGAQLPRGAALVALTAGGLALARRLQAVLPEASVLGLEGRADGADETFDDAAAAIRGLFQAGRPVVGVCAAGILVRALAPLLSDKGAEPPVVAVGEDGGAAVPLLGGHRGANALARAIAAATGGQAAITTAGDLRLGFALDEPPPGWRLANPEAAKEIAAALLAGEPVALAVEAGNAAWLRSSRVAFAEAAPRRIRVTARSVGDPGGDLIYHPPVLAVGVGCERGAEPGEVVGLVERALAGRGLAAAAVACVASIDLKVGEEAVHAAAARLAVPARFFTAAELEREAPRLANPSERVFREVGCHGVAEGAALAAAGPAAALVVEKTAAGRATCAVAEAPADIDGGGVGRPQGRLFVVGIGPGPPAWRTPEAAGAIARSSDVVALPRYLDLVADLLGGKAVHPFPLGEEQERTRRALDLAAQGRAVALLGSGDAGVYGLAALVFELLEREGRAEWSRVRVEVAPGLSALQAAAARAGAPLGHDFCAISLSDLLTPWAEIERRLEAAAAGDFAVALYNPASRRRRWQLGRAKEILLRLRPPSTPVVLARNLGRDGESVEVLALDAFDPGRADMLTLVLVGSSRTKAFQSGARRWVYTPRGYAARSSRRGNKGMRG
jgi:cobalt-precorrin 5A hydrolase/precorrin-3B C17-methyltransferase